MTAVVVLEWWVLLALIGGGAGVGVGAFGFFAYRRASNAAMRMMDTLDELTNERTKLHTLMTEWAADLGPNDSKESNDVG